MDLDNLRKLNDMNPLNQKITERSLEIMNKLMSDDVSANEAMATLALTIIASAKGMGIPKKHFIENMSNHWDAIVDPDAVTTH